MFRKYFPVHFFAVFMLSVFSGCDIIEPPYTTDHSQDNGNGGEQVRKVLLEEFTGHHCPNCPEGSAMAKDLQSYYGDRLVIMSIHAGWFARVTPDAFNYDFTTPEGDAFYDFFGISQNPIGMVNRKPYEASLLLTPAAWAEAIEDIIHQEPEFNIQIASQPITGQASFAVDVDVAALINSDETFYLSAFIIEDYIIKPQKTNNPEYPDGVIPDYAHMHVLRKGINGTWGERLSDGSIHAGEQFLHTYNVSLNSDWVPEHCSVIAFVYHYPSREIMQVASAPLQ